MRKFVYVEPGLDMEAVIKIVREDEILAKYFPWWKKEITKKKRLLDLSEDELKERCIEDFCTVHWAHEVTKNDS